MKNANITELPRYLTKIFRDGAKAGYDKDTKCFICGSDTDLNFHHFNTVSVLVNDWVKKNGYVHISAEDAFTTLRTAFIAEYNKELYVEAATLCKEHHMKLHSIYGRNPTLATAEKQKRWVQRQREKHGLI